MSRPRDPSTLAAALGLALLAGAVYWPSLGYGFLSWDDDLYAGHPRVLTGLSWPNVVWALETVHGGNRYPATLLSHMLDAELFGARAWGPRLVNLLLHWGNGLLLFAVLRRMTGHAWRSAAAAAVFVVHPLQVETVAWISERKNLLCAFFCLCSLLGYERWTRGGGRAAFGLSLAAYAAALASKAMATPLAAGLLALDFWPLRRRLPWRGLLIEKAPFAALAGATALAALTAASPRADLSLAARACNAASSAVEYLRDVVWPAGLSPFYAHPGSGAVGLGALAAALAVGALSWVVWRGRARAPWALSGWLWFLVMLAPGSGLVQVGEHARADRHLYLPLMGLLWAAVWSLPAALSPRLAALACAGGVSALMAVSALQLRHWQDGLALWRRAAAVGPPSDLVLSNLGYELYRAGRFEEAQARTRQALELNADNGRALHNLGQGLLSRGQCGPALAALERASALLPREPAAAAGLAEARACVRGKRKDRDGGSRPATGKSSSRSSAASAASSAGS